MIRADRYLIHELGRLSFDPYEKPLPVIQEHMESFYRLEKDFAERYKGRLTKRHAVTFGLLARSFQLSASCLANQLHQNYAGWNASFRALLETFFVLDWIGQDFQRFEAYFEESAPGIGRIKADCCNRNPQYLEIYNEVTKHSHVSDSALYLPRQSAEHMIGGFPFCATNMSISGYHLEQMIGFLEMLLGDIDRGLQFILVANAAALDEGAMVWEDGSVRASYGCLGYEPKEPVDG